MHTSTFKHTLEEMGGALTDELHSPYWCSYEDGAKQVTSVLNEQTLSDLSCVQPTHLTFLVSPSAKHRLPLVPNALHYDNMWCPPGSHMES